MKIAKQEVSLIDHCGTDLSVVNAARVSFHKESEWEAVPGKELFEKNSHKLSDKDAKLIHYLAKHNHKSPFNHCFLSFRVKAPLMVARQLVKHEYLPWNEVSRRYVDDEPECYLPSSIRLRPDSSIKQGSGPDADKETQSFYRGIIAQQFEDSLEVYNMLLEAGIAPEQARMVLPQSMMTEWLWSGTLFAFVKMLKLRLDPHAQQETREVAEQIAVHVKELFPVSFSALMEN